MNTTALPLTDRDREFIALLNSIPAPAEILGIPQAIIEASTPQETQT